MLCHVLSCLPLSYNLLIKSFLLFIRSNILDYYVCKYTIIWNTPCIHGFSSTQPTHKLSFQSHLTWLAKVYLTSIFTQSHWQNYIYKLETLNILFEISHIHRLIIRGARCSSVVRVFAHGAMGHRIDPWWGEPIELFLVPASAPQLV